MTSPITPQQVQQFAAAWCQALAVIAALIVALKRPGSNSAEGRDQVLRVES